MPEESKLAEKLENATKFTEEELTKLREIQDEYIKIQSQFGQLKMAEIRHQNQATSLENEEEKIRKTLKDVQDNEQKFLDEITKKYGQGSLNPETGVFTPTENKSE